MKRSRQWAVASFALATLVAVAFGNAYAAVPGYQTLTGVFILPPNQHGGTTVNCPAGKLVLSGGYHIEVPSATSPLAPFYATRSAPVLSQGKYGWIVSVRNNANVPITINIYAICADF